jgi:hypothetical protein
MSCSACTSKLQTRPLVRDGAPQEGNRIVPMDEKEKLVMESSWWPDTRTGLYSNVGRKIILILNSTYSYPGV